jgi:hypothetical protein
MKTTQLSLILDAVADLARRYRLDEYDVTRAQSQAWFYAQACPRTYPAHYWAKVAVRAIRNGRDLPGTATPSTDALARAWLCVPMGDVRDPGPGPDALASHREAMEALEDSFNPTERYVARLAQEGASGLEIAEAIGRSPGRVSQIKRELAERWAG